MLGSAAKWKIDSWVAPAIVFSLALLLFSINLDRPPHPDELHHVLAAQHLLETGRPVLAEGEYWRGILYTWLVAISYEVFGEGLASARIPAVLLVALVAPILFLWVRREAGSLAAWLTAVLFISSPFTVEIAQFCRFYSLQIVFFTLGAICVYYALAAAEILWRRVLLGALATVLLALAYEHQVTSLAGIVGIAVWIFGLLVHRAFFNPGTGQAVRKGLIALFVVAGVLAVVAVTMTGLLEWAWDWFRYVQVFNADRRNEFWFYHLFYILYYPTLWSLVGFLAVFAIMRNPRLAWFSVSVFGISFLFFSFAATKGTRYFSFAPPFMTILWGVGLAYILPLLWRYAQATRIRLIETFELPNQLSSRIVTAGIYLAIAIVVVTNPFWLRTAAMIGNVALPFETPTTDWRAAREALAPRTTNADIMITTEELGAIYFLGRSDVRFSPSKFEELRGDERKEFGLDYRTGRPVISTPESLEQLIECFPRGLIVGPIEDWGSPILINKAVQAILLEHAEPIEVPKESYLYAWGWERETPEITSDYCSDLSRFSGREMR